MKTFRIGVFEEQGGYMNIKAKTETEAKKIALELITDEGMNERVEITHRDVSLV